LTVHSLLLLLLLLLLLRVDTIGLLYTWKGMTVFEALSVL
jgi:hypothetical protein